MEDGEPVGIRTGEARHFLKQNSAGDGDFGFGTDGSFAAKDPEEVFVAEDLECDVGRLPVCGEVGKPGVDFFEEIGVVD